MSKEAKDIPRLEISKESWEGWTFTDCLNDAIDQMQQHYNKYIARVEGKHVHSHNIDKEDTKS